MNRAVLPRPELDVMINAVESLTFHGLKAELLPVERGKYDGILKVRHGKRTLKFRLEAKKLVTRGTIGTFLFQHRNVSSDLVLVAEYISQPIADQLRRNEIQFLDAAGNAFLQRDGLYVFVTGRRSRTSLPAERPSRAFQESGLKLTFALLSEPELTNQPFRTIAAGTGVAIGTVHWVMRDLRSLGFVAELRGQRRLIDRPRLVTEWTEAYNRVLRPKLLLGRFAADESNWWSAADVRQYGAVWGGETAAAKLTDSIKPGVASIYSSSIPNKLLMKFHLRPDPVGSVEIRQRFWHFSDTWQPREVTPPLLIYADLLAVGDSRSAEAARLIYTRYLSGSLVEK